MSTQINEAITATDLARNLAITIDKVRLSRKAINIVKGNQTVAQLSPVKHGGLPITQLENFLRNLPHLESAHTQNMASDLQMLRENATLPDDLSWE